jgi:ribosome-associated translation inhibitor RaiA
MQIQVHTDHNIAGISPADRVRTVVESALSHIAEHVTRVEVHLSDVNSHKGDSTDKRCVMEARVAGHKPMAVSHQADNMGQAIDGAADKLRRSVEKVLERQQDLARSGTRPEVQED